MHKSKVKWNKGSGIYSVYFWIKGFQCCGNETKQDWQLFNVRLGLLNSHNSSATNFAASVMTEKQSTVKETHLCWLSKIRAEAKIKQNHKIHITG